MKKTALLLQLILVSTCYAAQYRLFDDNYLDVGNEWFYDTTITIQDNVSVNIPAAGFIEITGEKTVGAYNTAIISIVDPSSTILDYQYMTPDFVLEAGYDYSDSEISMHGTYRNNNPLEIFPVWVDESYNNYLFGTGEFDLTLDDPLTNWTESFETRITFLQSETVTVPAGTFDCLTVFVRSDWTDSLGFYGYTTKTASICPDVGTVKSEDYIWTWDQ